MRRATLFTVALLAVALLAVALVAGCGEDDSDFDPPPSNQADVFRSNLAAQCQQAKEEQKALKSPIGGDSQDLATYLRKIIELESDLREDLESFEPPADLAAGVRAALAEEAKLSEIVAGYERAARGGRDVELILGQLETELNPQIRRANRAFGAIEIPGCQGDELDLGFADRSVGS